MVSLFLALTQGDITWNSVETYSWTPSYQLYIIEFANVDNITSAKNPTMLLTVIFCACS